MVKTALKIDGMACGMCEAHVNDTLRKIPGVVRSKADHKKGEAVVESEGEIPLETFEAALNPTGYKVLGISSGEAEGRKGLFGFLHRGM